MQTSTLLLATLLAASTPAMAVTAWNEAVSGDLSGNGLAPTAVAMSVGLNEVLGTAGTGSAGIDRDYFTFVVPAGHQLTALNLLPNTTVSGSASFLAIQAGPQVTVSPSGAGVAALLGYMHYTTDQIGTDLLPVLIGSGALPSGAYSIWLQDTGSIVDYGLQFQITVVPEPASGLMAAMGLLALAGLRHRRQAAATH